ncbi:MAG: patatin-like phospholipase family protein [Pseudomonadota bacterium]
MPTIKIGVAWGSGAARGWAHVGVIRAFEEIGIPIHVEAGCSVGALVSAARRLGIWEEFLAWAREIGPIGALSQFALSIGAGGFVNPAGAFDSFRYADKDITDLHEPWGAVATDLATGREVWLTKGSVLDAARASSSIPMVMQAAAVMIDGAERWMIDGAASNPVPVSLARALGADRVIAVDLNASATTLTRFVRPRTRAVVPVEEPPAPSKDGIIPEPVVKLIRETQAYVQREMALAKAKAQAKPHFFETAAATLDIVQTHLAAARAHIDVADVRIQPDLDGISPAAFDQHAEIEERGYLAAMDVRSHLEELIAEARAEA